MPYLIIRHKVKDFDTWKPIFDLHATARQAAGSKGGHLLRNSDDPNEVILVLEVEDLRKAREFARSADLRETMVRAGVVDKPDIYFLDEAGRLKA